MENQSNTRLPSSFRDPSGYVFLKDSRVYRKINASYVPVFNHMQSTGIFSRLFDSGLLCPHSIIETNEDSITIQPREIPFISYPYEWCFSQLKDAARCTLRLQKLALENEMSLKDASAYNIQFADGKPVLIDSLSFEQFSPGSPGPRIINSADIFWPPGTDVLYQCKPSQASHGLYRWYTA